MKKILNMLMISAVISILVMSLTINAAAATTAKGLSVTFTSMAQLDDKSIISQTSGDPRMHLTADANGLRATHGLNGEELIQNVFQAIRLNAYVKDKATITFNAKVEKGFLNIFFRSQDGVKDEDTYHLQVGAVSQTNRNAKFAIYEGNEYDQLSGDPFLEVSQWHTYKIVLDGSSMTCYVDGAINQSAEKGKTQTTDSLYKEGYVGIYFYNAGIGVDATIKDINITIDGAQSSSSSSSSSSSNKPSTSSSSSSVSKSSSSSSQSAQTSTTSSSSDSAIASNSSDNSSSEDISSNSDTKTNSPETPPKKSNLLLIVIPAIIVILAAGGTFAYFTIKRRGVK